MRAVSALFLIAAVRRVRQPGCKFDEMLVLESPQGFDKSSAMEAIAYNPDWYFSDLPLNADARTVIENLRGKWIVESAELNGMRKGEIEHLKAFLSRQRDRARKAFGRVVDEIPRQCVFVGTTNAARYLKDLTGNRRFWPLIVIKFDIAALTAARDQLWAEAAAREAAGESIRLDPSLWDAAAAAQADRVIEEPFVEWLQEVLGDTEGKIASSSIWTILDVRVGTQGQEQNRRVGDAMRHLGWKKAKTKVRIDGKPVHAYIKGPQPWRTIKAERDRDSLRVWVEADASEAAQNEPEAASENGQDEAGAPGSGFGKRAR